MSGESGEAHAEDVAGDGLDVLMLGVTPGIATMRWPLRSRILAVDISPAVIRALWPGDVLGHREARCASWFDALATPSSLDMVIGDGSLNTCRYPGEVHALCNAVSVLLRPGAKFAVRTYVQPAVAESIDAVFDALLSSAGLNVDEFKLRLYLAMQRDSREGVAVRDAAQVLDAFGVDSRFMKQRLGWTDLAVKPFEKWQVSDAVYTFPKLTDLRAVLSEQFEEISATYPANPMGCCCPVLVMSSRLNEPKQGSV